MLIIVQERTLDDHKKLVEGILKRDKKRRKRIEAAGIDYECPEMVRHIWLSLIQLFDAANTPLSLQVTVGVWETLYLVNLAVN